MRGSLSHSRPCLAECGRAERSRGRPGASVVTCRSAGDNRDRRIILPGQGNEQQRQNSRLILPGACPPDSGLRASAACQPHCSSFFPAAQVWLLKAFCIHVKLCM